MTNNFSEKIIKHSTPILLLIESVIELLLFFPTFEIFGYFHTVPATYDQTILIKISPTTLFSLLSDSYYSIGLKTSYVFMFIMQILTIFMCVILLLFSFIKIKKECFKIVFFISIICLIIECTFASILFCNYLGALILDIIILIVNLIVLVISILYFFKLKKESKNV